MKKVFGIDDLAPFAIRWVLMHKEVSVVIPRASRASRLQENIRAAEIPPLTEEQMRAVRKFYDHELRSIKHEQW